MITLAPFTEEDFDRLIGWMTTQEEYLFWTAYVFPYPLTRETLARHLRESAERGDRLIFKGVLTESGAESGEAVGHLELGALDVRNRSVRIGRVLVGPEFRGRGFGEEMMRAALAIAFGQLGMHRVELGVFDVNPRAIACYERVGFRHDGVRRESFKVAEGYWTEVIMSILAPEWAGGA
jgi:RimJ/RimL family protein N-acetyltransferase